MPTAIRRDSAGGGDDDRGKRVVPGSLTDLSGDSHNPRIPANERRGAGAPVAQDAYLAARQDPSTYLTTNELAKLIGSWPEQVYRWCVRWFGTLPPERRGRGLGYRIPPEYLYVARAFQQVEDPGERKLLQEVIPADPKNFVLLVGKSGSTHYSAREVVERVDAVLPLARQHNLPIRILWVGPTTGDNEHE